MPPKASEPESGSVIAQAPTVSNVTRPGSQRSFCASVPRLRIVPAANPRLTPNDATRPRLTPAKSLLSTTPMLPAPLKALDFSPSPEGASPRSRASDFSRPSRAMSARPKVEYSLRMMSNGGSAPLSSSST